MADPVPHHVGCMSARAPGIYPRAVPTRQATLGEADENSRRLHELRPNGHLPLPASAPCEPAASELMLTQEREDALGEAIARRPSLPSAQGEFGLAFEDEAARRAQPVHRIRPQVEGVQPAVPRSRDLVACE